MDILWEKNVGSFMEELKSVQIVGLWMGHLHPKSRFHQPGSIPRLVTGSLYTLLNVTSAEMCALFHISATRNILCKVEI